MALDLESAITAFNGATSRADTTEGKSQLNIDVAYGLKARMALSTGD